MEEYQESEGSRRLSRSPFSHSRCCTQYAHFIPQEKEMQSKAMSMYASILRMYRHLSIEKEGSFTIDRESISTTGLVRILISLYSKEVW